MINNTNNFNTTTTTTTTNNNNNNNNNNGNTDDDDDELYLIDLFADTAGILIFAVSLIGDTVQKSNELISNRKWFEPRSHIITVSKVQLYGCVVLRRTV